MLPMFPHEPSVAITAIILSWFAIWQRSVPDRLIRGLEKRRYQEPGQLDLFKEKVEKHNETFAVTLEEEDDDVVDDEILTFEEEI